MRLDSHLQGELEAPLGLDRCAVEQAPAVQLEIAGGVMGADAGKPVQRDTGGPRKGALEPRTTNLATASNITGTRYHVGSALGLDQHPIHHLRL
ncbi:MAG: hypothetical protein M3Z13_04810, partial [Candidatus Dormibacteraeota bacterium]|nr:hypothetical protein [Candidatus Dormibacteraeota bacterium]